MQKIKMPMTAQAGKNLELLLAKDEKLDVYGTYARDGTAIVERIQRPGYFNGKTCFLGFIYRQNLTTYLTVFYPDSRPRTFILAKKRILLLWIFRGAHNLIIVRGSFNHGREWLWTGLLFAGLEK